MGAAEKSLQEQVLGIIARKQFSHDTDSGRLMGPRCESCGCETLELGDDATRLTCGSCGERFDNPLEYLLRQPSRAGGPAHETRRALESESNSDEADTARGDPIPALESSPPTLSSPHPSQLAAKTVELINSNTETTSARGQDEAPASHIGEKIIMALLALVFLAAGTLAAAMSGFANFLAFGDMVDDPFQSRVWAWTGIIACICSFGGFTFAYWHGAQRRFGEAFRAGLIAVAGAATSIVGTQMYMDNMAGARALEVQAAHARRGLLQAEIEDWRSQLAGIPVGTRSIEGLEAYIAEVERVGRTDERPYRLALDELGQARRRADLEARIDMARDELGELGAVATSVGAEPENPARAWFFAGMLEVFSSQGTSIGFVALLVLAGRRRGSGAEP